jgi:serine/threonine-protein kinase HipA
LNRHWISTANRCGFPEQETEEILQEFAERAEEWTTTVRQQLSDDFPEEIANSILQGVLRKCAAIN